MPYVEKKALTTAEAARIAFECSVKVQMLTLLLDDANIVQKAGLMTTVIQQLARIPGRITFQVWEETKYSPLDTGYIIGQMQTVRSFVQAIDSFKSGIIIELSDGRCVSLVKFVELMDDLITQCNQYCEEC